MIPFLSIFYRFWTHLGRQVGAMLGLCWLYVGYMLAIKPFQKPLQKKLKKYFQKSEPEDAGEPPLTLNNEDYTLSGLQTDKPKRTRLSASAVADIHVNRHRAYMWLICQNHEISDIGLCALLCFVVC